jgi:hypothetical protein
MSSCADEDDGCVPGTCVPGFVRGDPPAIKALKSDFSNNILIKYTIQTVIFATHILAVSIVRAIVVALEKY